MYCHPRTIAKLEIALCTGSPTVYTILGSYGLSSRDKVQGQTRQTIESNEKSSENYILIFFPSQSY